MDKVICIVGPTAVGKTKLGVEIAKKYNGEIISADSVQVYRGLDIGSAKVTELEKSGIKHHLIDILNPDEQYDVKKFVSSARKLIKNITDSGKIPIVVGGTGLYIKALLYDYNLSIPERSDNFAVKYSSLSNEELWEKLRLVDESSAKKFHFNNRIRVLRALEIYHLTGKSKSEHLENKKNDLLFDAQIVGLTTKRDQLYMKINARVDEMFDEGLVEEVKNITKNYTKEINSLNSIGYKEVISWLKNEICYNEMKELIKKNSRNFAKRQITWFKNQLNVTWIDVNYEDFLKTIEKVDVHLKGWLKG